jgi:hypothetical protein
LAARCKRCGSTERRPNGKGCKPCNNFESWLRTPRNQAKFLAEPDDDIIITPAMQRYLAAFDGYLRAGRDGDGAAMRAGEYWRHVALKELLD